MTTEEILLDVSTKFAELTVLCRKLIATKVEDVATIGALQTELNVKNAEVMRLLEQDERTKGLASSLADNVASLIAEASAAIPPEVIV